MVPTKWRKTLNYSEITPERGGGSAHVLNGRRDGMALAMRPSKRGDCPNPRQRAFYAGRRYGGFTISERTKPGSARRIRGHARKFRARSPSAAIGRLSRPACRHRTGRATDARASTHERRSRRRGLCRRQDGREAGRDQDVAVEGQALGAMCSGRSTAMSRCAVRMVTVKPPSTSTQLSASSIRNVALAARGTAMNTTIITMNNTNDRM